jgi:hypothetical protein
MMSVRNLEFSSNLVLAQIRILCFDADLINTLIQRTTEFNEKHFTCSVLSFFYNILDEESNVPKAMKNTFIIDFCSKGLLGNDKDVNLLSMQVLYIISFVIPEGRDHIHSLKPDVVHTILKNLIDYKNNETWARCSLHTITCIVEGYIDILFTR